MDQYPYQTAFHRELKAIGRAQMTIDAYDATLRQLFNYLEDQRPIYAHDPSANNVTETDVRAYLNWLRDEPGHYPGRLLTRCFLSSAAISAFCLLIS